MPNSICHFRYDVRLELSEGAQGKMDSVEALVVSHGTLVTGKGKHIFYLLSY